MIRVLFIGGYFALLLKFQKERVFQTERENAMKGDWSDWMFFGEEQLISIPKRPGVYEFRCTDGNGNPMVIDRLNGKDTEGIIYIGSSEELGQRINGFWKTIKQQDRSRHAAGWTYCSFGYNNIFHPTHLP